MILSENEIKEAIKYNNKQGLPENLIVQLQQFSGSPETGKWSEETIKGIVVLQRMWKLSEDGKVGPKTLEKVSYIIDTTNLYPKNDSRVSVMCWVNVVGRYAVKNVNQYILKLKDLGINEISLMLNSSSDSILPNFKWSVLDLTVFTKIMHESDIRVGITYWPRPRKSYLENLFDFVEECVKEAKVDFIENEVEGNWGFKGFKKFKESSPFKTYDESSAYLVKETKRIGDAYGVETRATTFANHWELDSRGDGAVLAEMDTVSLQVYSRWDDGDRSTKTRYAPGKFQKYGMDRVRKVGLKNKIIIGLAAFDQKGFPDLSDREAMLRAVDGARAEGITDIGYWSYKWILENDYAYDFIESLHKKT